MEPMGETIVRGRPLGQVLKWMEILSEGQIQEALQIQRQKGGLFGEILVGLGYVAKDEIEIALMIQKGIKIDGWGDGPPPVSS
jgi:hypothetical protein